MKPHLMQRLLRFGVRVAHLTGVHWALRKLLFPRLQEPRVVPILGGAASGLRISVSLTENRSYVLGTYAAEEMDVLRTLSTGATLAFDIGAHWGYSTLVISRGAEQVVAVEAAPENLANLRATLRANDLCTRIRVVPAAVADTVGSAALSSGRTSFQGHLEDGGLRRVETVTLDSLAAEMGVPDLVKLDIEGGAALAFQGAKELVARRSTRFFVEIHDEAEVGAVESLQGYRLRWLDDTHVVATPQ